MLQSLDAIARANAKGEYVVGLGTQQFTVLALHDRWVELTPRANLRHFPDMARGYLMWFYYNGFIHFAGQAKPRTICGSKYSDNDLRINTYTPWAMTILSLQKTCQPQPQLQPQPLPVPPQVSSTGAAVAVAVEVQPAKTGFGVLQADGCADLLLRAATFPALLALVSRLASISADDNLWYVRLGALSSDLSGVEPLLRVPPAPATVPTKPAGRGGDKTAKGDGTSSSSGSSRASVPGSSAAATGSVGVASVAVSANASMAGVLSLLAGRHGRGLEVLDRLVLTKAAWSLRVIDRDPARLTAADGLLSAQQTQWGARIKRAANSYQAGSGSKGGASRRRLKGDGSGKRGKDKVGEGRTWATQHMALCDQLAAAQLTAADHIKSISADFYSPTATAAVNSSLSASPAGALPIALPIALAPSKCVHLLPEIKAQGKKHWDVIGLVIDYQPTVALPWANRCADTALRCTALHCTSRAAHNMHSRMSTSSIIPCCHS